MTIAALPAAAGILRSTAHPSKQGGGERTQLVTHNAHNLTSDHGSKSVGRFKAAPAQAHTGGGDRPGHTKSIPFLNVAAVGVGRGTLGNASIGEISIHEQFHVSRATAATRDAKGESKPAVKATHPHHSMASKQEGTAKLQSSYSRQLGLPGECGDCPTGRVARWDRGRPTAHTGPARETPHNTQGKGPSPRKTLSTAPAGTANASTVLQERATVAPQEPSES